jgi:hypothetical protein
MKSARTSAVAIICALLLGATAAAKADTFNVSGTETSTGDVMGTCSTDCTFGGTVTIDTTTGTVTGVDITYPDIPAYNMYVSFDASLDELTLTNSAGENLNLYLSVASLVNFDGASILGGQAFATLGLAYEGSTGSITAPATTPILAALPLFAGGLGFVGYLMCRRKQAVATA